MRLQRRKSKLMNIALSLLPNECVVCGETNGLELDHIIPLAQGGADTIENVQFMCSYHHRMKTTQQRRQQMARVTNDGKLIQPTFPRKKLKLKPAGSRSRWSGRQEGW